MSNSFVDTAKINIKAGRGGDGKVSFLRERHQPKGGPDGGDGGNGGNVILKVNPNMATLMDFRSKPKHKAKSGIPGGPKNMKGENGDDLVIYVPKGTLIFDIKGDSETLVGDLVENGRELRVATGGTGGKGNSRFKSSVNRTPTQYTPGSKGEERNLRLEIKLLADIGLVGFPNAGKSTLINRLTGANAKVADYPFTTLNPNLGVCELKNGNKIIVADLPGLIEGAAEGKGLGDEFLRHIERTRLIVHLIDPFSLDEEDLVEKSLKSYDAIRKELKDHGAQLEEKKEIVVVNKMDITEVREAFESIKEAFKERDLDVLGISSLSGDGIDSLLERITQELDEIPEKTIFSVKKPVKVYTINDLPNRRLVFKGNQTITLIKKLK